MLIDRLKTLSTGVLLLGLSSTAFAHGLVQSPPARNSFCSAPSRIQTRWATTARSPSSAQA